MSEWKEIFIDSACSRLSSGKSISSSLIKDKGDYPVYGGNGIRGFTNTYNFDGECAIIGRQGASCGNVRYFSGKAYMTEHAVVAVPTKEHNAYYLSCVLASLKLGRLSGQSAQPGIGVGLIGKQNIIMPSLATQQKIASILSSLDSKIENNRKICANLEAQAQALFKHWFIDFAPFKDGKFVESELGMIPEGWRVGTFGDVVEQITDKVKDRKDIKVLSPINSGELVLSDEYFTKQVYSKSIEKYILVKPLDFAYNPARVNIGSIGMNEFDFDGCVSPVYVVFRCIPEYHFYIDMVRKGAYFKRNVNKLAIGGVRQTLRYEDLSRINLIIPPLSIIRDYNTFHYKIKESVKYLIQENLRLSSLRDTLLPKLMSGEIKV